MVWNYVAALHSILNYFYLQVDGDPHPTVRWSKDGAALESGKRVKVVAGKGLRLLNVRPAVDAGVYTCIAENEAGSVEASTEVAVPEPPVSVSYPS